MITPKDKPCKGIGPAKGHGCGRLTMHRVHGLGKMCCYPDWLLNTPEGKAKMERAIINATAPRREFEKVKKEHKNRTRITEVLESVRSVFHEYVRTRDEGKPCISCGTPWKSDFDAGHFYKAELFSSLRFNQYNVHGQCIHCNRRLEGNLNMYEINLPNRIGTEEFEKLKKLARDDKKNYGFKWDREELKKIRAYYRTKMKEL